MLVPLRPAGYYGLSSIKTNYANAPVLVHGAFFFYNIFHDQ
jgi:hypothetical protein